MIKIANVGFTYENTENENAIRDITIEISKGEVVLLCGESGSGKTTFGRLINGLIPIYYEGKMSGTVMIEGMNTKEIQMYELAEHVGSVFQNPKSQFYTLLADTEMVFGCENIGLSKDEILKRFEETVQLFQIEKLLGKSLLELSGGEKQKIACAAVHMSGSDIIVLDEPTSNLDIQGIRELKFVIEQWKKKGKTIFIIEHRLSWMKELVDRVLYFKDGRIQEDIASNCFWKWSPQEFHFRGLRYGKSFVPKSKQIENKENYIFKDFQFSYQNGLRLEIPEIQIPQGSVVAILGNNGAGKSTFAKCICGLMKQCKGKILSGKKIYKGRKLSKLAYMVFQDVNHQLFSESVQEEITLGIPFDKVKEKEDQINGLLQEMQLSKYKKSHPMALSGGQKQRLAVASAIASEKNLIIYDEPTSGLDYHHMEIVAEMINDLSTKGKTQLIITHDPELVERCCDSFLFLENGRMAYNGTWTDENVRLIRHYFECFS